MTGGWYLRQLYEIAYYPLAVTIWILGAAGMLPRAKRSTGDEWRERRCFYGAVWAVCLTQPVLWLLCRAAANARGRRGEARRLRGRSGGRGGGWRTTECSRAPKSIVPGELAISD